MRYSAFISYNHRDRAWAVWLHRALERYRVPKRLWGRPAPWGTLEARLPPVFRDRDELATSTDLAASVKAALAESATLVVICSPNSARSRWVDEEIRTFIAAGRAQYVRLIIVDGEPHSPDPTRECLPPSLTADGAPEPLAADVRKSGDGKAAAKLKLLAGILGVPYDELRQREAARRHQRLLAFATAASVGFLVMAGLTVFALISRAEAVRQREVAVQRTATAERTLDFVKGMFAVADPSEARGASITAREIVDRAADKLDVALKDEPTVKAELGVTLAEVYGALGLYRKGDALVRRTFSLAPVAPATRARQLAALGESQARLGDYDAAKASFRRALDRAGEGSPALRSRILVGLGQAFSALDEFGPADRVLRAALGIDEARGGGALADQARDLEALGLNHFYAGRLDQAEPLARRALALRRQVEGPNSPSVSDNLNALGTIAYARRDLAAAERYFRGNVAVDEQVLGRSHPDVATTLNNLARVLLERRRFGEAAALLERAIAISLPERGPTHDDMAFQFANLGIARRHLGRLGEAEGRLNQAIAAARANQHRTLGPSLADLADVFCATGRTRQGLALLDEAARVSRTDYPDDPWRSAWVDNIRGECLIRAGRGSEGRQAIAASSPVISQAWPAGTLFAVEAKRRLRLAGA
ncbi:tetratricopeptide repeat protein [Sphingomonas sp.]|uniref:tetratricopeptide repeat protein n=1 Tax=Sphingomonas sp. TaxID=28214 RepID=UPI00286D9B87|nr:tetratricopeptide repeat protein [Sphingomonas sp.]